MKQAQTDFILCLPSPPRTHSCHHQRRVPGLIAHTDLLCSGEVCSSPSLSWPDASLTRWKRGVSTAEKKTWTRGTYAHLGSWSQEVLASLPSLPTAPPPSTGSEDPHPPLSRQAVHQELPPHSCHIHTHRDRAPPYTHLYGEPRPRTALSFILVLTNLRNYKRHHSLRLEFPLLWFLMKVSIHFPSLLPPGLGLFCFSVLCLSCHLPPSSYLSPQPPMPTK